MLCAFLTRTGRISFARFGFGVDRDEVRDQPQRRRPQGQERHIGPHAAASRPPTLSERADELEEQMMDELNDKIATKSVLFTLGDGRPTR